MADLDRLKQALIAADAAGDTDAARALAGAIRAQSASPETQAPQQDQGSPTLAPSPEPQAGKPGLAGAYKRVLGDASEWEKGLSLSGVGRGLTDLRDAGSQMIGRTLMAVAPKGSGFEKWATDQTKIVEDRNAAGEKSYQDKRAAAGDTGLDFGRLAGNVLATAPLGGPTAQSLLGRVLQNAGLGAAASSVSQPVFDPEKDGGYWSQKGKQAGLGAGSAVAMMPITSALGRVISPNASRNPNVQRLLDEDVSLTPGMMGGGMVKRAEDAATSIPLLGDAIRTAQRGATEDLDRAALNRVLAPLGQQAPSDMRMGREAIDHVQRQVGDAYDRVLSRLTVAPDQAFVADTTGILTRLQGVDPQIARQFGNFFQTRIVDRFAPNGQVAQIDGRTLKSMESEITNLASRYGSSPDAAQRTFGQALGDLRTMLRDLVTRTNPQEAAALGRVNDAFRNLAVVEKAAGSAGAVEGVFSPNQLSAAVKSSDRSVRDRAFAAGRATMQDLSDAAKAVMPSSVPDSGTPLRALAGAGLLGGGAMVSPYAAAAGAGATALYTQPGLWLMQQLMARRPQMAQPIAQGLLSANPALGSAVAPPIAMGLLN